MSDKNTTEQSAIELDESVLDETVGGGTSAIIKADSNPVEWKLNAVVQKVAPIVDGTSNIVVKL